MFTNKTMRHSIIGGCGGLLLLALLSACGAGGATQDQLKLQPYSAAAEQACVAKGGKWERMADNPLTNPTATANATPLFHCARAFSDAGKSCTDSKECQGLCLHNERNYQPNVVVQGFCQSHDTRAACVSEMSNGVALPRACI